MIGESQKPLVTVVICVYNAGEFLRASIESILRQTYRNLEVILVDDGSTDACFAGIADLSDRRMRILRQENRGKPAALNRALAEMRGEFFAVHDADDLSHPRRIERQVQCMRRYPDIAAVFCGYDLILNGRNIAPKFGPKDEAQCRQDIQKMQMPGHDPTAMYRVSMVGGLRFDEQLPIVEGLDYVIRVGEQFPMRVIGECLYSYRIHWNTVTKRSPATRQRMLRSATQKIYARRALPCDEARLPEVTPQSRVRNKHLDNDIVSHFMVSMVDLRHAGGWREAAQAAAACVSLHPFDPYYYKPAAYAVLPLPLIDWYRARKYGKSGGDPCS